MLNVDQLRQLSEQTAEAAKFAEARIGIFHEEHEADLLQLAVTNAAAARDFHKAIAAKLAEKEASVETQGE